MRDGNAVQAVIHRLNHELAQLTFSAPVAHVYRPLEYAGAGWQAYLDRYGAPPRPVLLVGMNPGPWGMAQTGVPFGDVEMVRGWLGIEAEIQPPPHTHPKKPVAGFACHRSEVSGKRLWSWARERFGDPAAFFRHFFVANYCPLLFLTATGANLTPAQLPAGQRRPLEGICDRALADLVRIYHPTWVIGVGRFAGDRCRTALAGLHVQVGTILHPSPANPHANRDWRGVIEHQFKEMGVPLP